MAIKRRDFLKTTSVLGSGLALAAFGSNLTGCKSIATKSSSTGNLGPFGLQLYTLRDDMPKDPKGILKQVASYGYTQLEGFEGPMGIYWGMTNKEFKKYISDLGMTMISTHCDINQDFERKAAEAAEIGMKYLIEPYLGPQKSADDFKRAAQTFNEKGQVCKQHGLRFAYHNHDYSFVPIEGQLPQDIMMQNTDPSLVDFEMDIYWVVTGGQDPIAWFNKYPNRFRLCHVKDRKNAPLTDKDASVDLGKGFIDFPKILKEGKSKGLEYYFLEQEKYENTTPLEAAKVDADYLKKVRI